MAATLTPNVRHETVYSLQGFLTKGGKIMQGSVALDSSYPTGGESVEFPFTPQIVLAEPSAGYIFQYDYTNEKLKAYYADYDAAADGALIEVANAVNLSALDDIRVLAIGW